MGTKLTLEVTYPDGEILITTQETNRYDLTFDDMSGLTELLMRGAGYYFDEPDDAEYEVAEDPVVFEPESKFGVGLGAFDPSPIPCCSPSQESLLASRPCVMCEEPCEDTACLHREDRF